MKIILAVLLGFGSLGGITTAQSHAGESTYDFLTLTSTAKGAALGGNQVGLSNGDINMMLSNPAALNRGLDKAATINIAPYVSGITRGYAAYAHDLGHFGTVGLGIQSINYGSFDRVDEFNNLSGTFSAAEYAIMLNYSKQLTPNLTAGLAFKPILSYFESYSSYGLAVDLGLMHSTSDSLFSAGITIKNIGSQLTTYTGTYAPLPFDVQIGMSRKLAHAPFRISLTAQDLFDWNTKYTVTDGNGEELVDAGVKGNAFNAIMRHMVIGVEFLPFDNFYIAAGYNHRMRLDMVYEEKTSTVGFSWGFGMKLNRFNIAYGSTGYHLNGGSNLFSITTNINRF